MSTKEAVEKLTSELKKDAGFRETYKANIAMAFIDAYYEEFPKTEKMYPFIRDIANKAADNFLNLWCS